jgi:histidinol-phosphate/aromatic aminotransferase/cobyric acid decarboxylase-like protein
MRPRPRPELEALAPAVHGGGAAPGELDASTALSPLAPPDEVVAAARAAALDRYPPVDAAPLRAAYARAAELTDGPDGVAIGAGSVELIWALARAFAGPDRRVVVAAPAFGEYAQAARASGATVTIAWTAREHDAGFTWDGAPLARALTDGAEAALVFLARPGSPTLVAPEPAALAALAAAHPRTLFVVDEAYQPVAAELPPLRPSENVAVLRSDTKLLGLAGLRLGALLAAAPVARAVRAALPPWNVSAPAQAAGLVAVEALARELAPRRARLAALAAAQRALVADDRLAPRAAALTFTVYRISGAPAVVAAAAARGVRLRDCTSFGLPGCVRVGLVDAPDQPRLAAALRAALDEVRPTS